MQLIGKKYPLSYFPDRLVVTAKIRQELEAAGVVTKLDSVETEGEEVTLWFTTLLTPEESGKCDFVAMAHRGSVEVAKQLAYTAIDQKTDAIIARGFLYGGYRFSLTLEAQCTMMGCDILKDDPNMVYPIFFNAIDDSISLPITNAAEVRQFSLSAVGHYRGAIDSGTALKTAVRNCTTIAEVEAIVDTRE